MSLSLYETGWGGRGHTITTRDDVLVAGEWNWVAFSVDLSVGRVVLMVNGRAVALDEGATLVPWTKFNATTTPLLLGALLGRNGAMGAPFRGDLDEVMLWRRALTDEELAAVASRGCGLVVGGVGSE